MAPVQLSTLNEPLSRKPVVKVLAKQPDLEPEKLKEARDAIAEIYEIFSAIQTLHDLTPRPEVNQLFSRLVALCIKPREDRVTQAVLQDQNINTIAPKIRRICSTAEGELETFWAHRMVEAAKASVNGARNVLQSFPYYDNYLDLSSLECSAMEAVLCSPSHSIAFIGSGPLPLTSFCMADRYPTTKVHNIDRDPQAIQLSTTLAKGLGYLDMTFSCENATHCSSLAEFDVVFLAALVGMDADEKFTVLNKVVRKMKHGALLCVRSAHSLRGLLYPVIDFSDELCKMGLELLLAVHPYNHVVNSLLVMRVSGT